MAMRGWRFFQKPVGLELYFLKPELSFTFFFLFFFSVGVLAFLFWGRFYGIGNQTPPSNIGKSEVFHQTEPTPMAERRSNR